MKARSCLIILTTCWFWDFRLSRKKSKLKTTYAYYPASLCEFPTFTGHLISRIWRDSNSLGFIFFDFKKQRHQISRFKFSLLHFILQKNKHNAFFEINFKGKLNESSDSHKDDSYMYNRGQKSLGHLYDLTNYLCFTTNVWKMRYFRLNKTLLYRLPAEYNVENQKNIMYLLVLLHVNHYFCYLNCLYGC